MYISPQTKADKNQEVCLRRMLWGFGSCLIPVETVSTFLARPSTLIQVASPNQPSVGLRSGVSSVFKTLEALFGSGPCEDVLCGIRGDSEIHLKGLLSPGPLCLPSPWNFPALPFQSSGLESSCSAVYFLGLCSPPRRSGWADREKAKGASPPSLDRSSPSSGGWLPSQEFRCLLVPIATVAPFVTGLLGFEAGMKKTAKRKKNREFSPLSWASTVFFLAPWPQGFSWRLLCPALRTTHGFQVSRSSGLGTEEGKWQSQAISAVLRILVSFLSVSATICFAESSNSWCLHSMQVWQPPPYGWLWPWHLTKGSVRSPRIPVCGTHLFCGCTLFTYYVSQTIRAREAAHL